MGGSGGDFTAAVKTLLLSVIQGDFLEEVAGLWVAETCTQATTDFSKPSWPPSSDLGGT